MNVPKNEIKRSLNVCSLHKMKRSLNEMNVPKNEMKRSLNERSLNENQTFP